MSLELSRLTPSFCKPVGFKKMLLLGKLVTLPFYPPSMLQKGALTQSLQRDCVDTTGYARHLSSWFDVVGV